MKTIAAAAAKRIRFAVFKLGAVFIFKEDLKAAPKVFLSAEHFFFSLPSELSLAKRPVATTKPYSVFRALIAQPANVASN